MKGPLSVLGCARGHVSTFKLLPAGQLSSTGSDFVGTIVDNMVREDLDRCLHEAPGGAWVYAQGNRRGSGKTADLAWVMQVTKHRVHVPQSI